MPGWTLFLYLADNLTEGIHKTKCKDCDCFLEYEIVKKKFDQI